jgi:hypothetical protein
MNLVQPTGGQQKSRNANGSQARELGILWKETVEREY